MWIGYWNGGGKWYKMSEMPKRNYSLFYTVEKWFGPISGVITIG